LTKKYKTAPIIEAVCEFRFSPPSKWDLAVPGLIYEQVKKEFPKRAQAQQARVQREKDIEPPQFEISLIDKVAFKAESEKQFIQVAPRAISVHRLAPYEEWETLFPAIEKAFDAYIKVGEPESIARIGLRYINAFDLPSPRVDLDEYFGFFPNVPEAIQGEVGQFIIGALFGRNEGRDVLRLTFTSGGSPEPNVARVLLDLDYYLERAGAVSIPQALEWVRNAHDRLEEAFEACLKDKARQLLEPI
jgi:uncharacterized protein (TIGR04255 family)